MRLFHQLIPVAVCVALALSAAALEDYGSRKEIVWEDLPPLPTPMSGQLIGANKNTLIVAGGTNWPISPYQGGVKDWLSGIYVLTPGAHDWLEASPLPHPLAYGMAVSYRDGVVCAGGSDGVQHYADAFMLRWHEGDVARTELPPLPRPCAYGAAGLVGDVMYVAGGQETVDATTAMHTFWSFDFTKPSEGWVEREPWPGRPRILAVAAGQEGAFYLFTGADLAAGPDGKPVRTYLTDGWKYTPATKAWTPAADMPRPAVAAPAVPVGPSHIFVFSGDNGELVDRIQELGDSHPGFPKEALAYHTVTNTWAKMGEIPESYVTTMAVPWQDGFVVPGGEDRPGHRGDRVLFGRPPAQVARFGGFDYVAMALYFVILVAIGIYFSRRENTTEDYFLGGRRVPWWAAGLSIFGTLLSAITFLSVPATSFGGNWMYYIGNLCVILGAPIIIIFFLPFFRKLTVASAYEYLELRFNVFVRLFGSVSFVLFQLSRVGIVLLLPALALSAATGIDKFLAIALMGVLCTLYTVMGGIEAVIWTDVVQVFVLLGGAILAFILIAGGVDGGLGAVISTGWQEDKLHMFDWTWEPIKTAVWVVAIGRFFELIIPYATDQTVVQRYMTTATEKEARKSILVGMIFSVPMGLVFFGMGTALFVFYKQNPAQLNPVLNRDAILPLFIVQHFPNGVAGIIIAAVFAAAMSSLDSSLNSVSAVVVTDFYDRFKKTEGDSLRLARWLTVIVGVFGTGMALYMAAQDVSSIWEKYMEYIGLYGGALFGIFALGIFSRRANGPGVIVGAICGSACLLAAKTRPEIPFLLYSTIGIIANVVVGYIASIIFSAFLPSKDVRGLTWGTRKEPIADGR